MQITLERQSKTIALSFNTDNSIAYDELYLAVQDKMSAIVNGGKFLASVVGKAFTIIGNAVSVLSKNIYVQGLTVAAAGGLGSRLAGGSFELGFLTAGLAFAVNQVVTQLAQERNPNPIGRAAAAAQTDSETHLPSLPQGVVDFSAGLGDGILLGYGDELRGILGIDGGIDPTSTEYGAGYVTGTTATTTLITRGALRGYRTGAEIRIGNNARIAPFGNRTGHPIGRYPHYHRRGIDPATGATRPGQGIGRHRPFETKSPDRSFGDRF